MSGASVDDRAAVVYVDSRSGKVLGSEDRSPTFIDGDYLEGELEGWIYWGNGDKRSVDTTNSNSSNGSKRGQNVFSAGRGSKGFIRKSLSAFAPIPWDKKTPFAVWGKEGANLIHDVFSPWLCRQIRTEGRKSTPIWKGSGECKNANLFFGPSVFDNFRPLTFSCSERSYQTHRNYKIGLSQLDVLQQWKPDTRELAARWVAWLLKMQRKTGSPQLQHLIFAACSAVLPVICCSLAREQRIGNPDQELCRCVDILWTALMKCQAFFTPSQWEILEESLTQCRQLRTKVRRLPDKDPQVGVSTNDLQVPDSVEAHRKRGMSNSPRCLSLELYQPGYVERDDKMSSDLLQRQVISALVKRAVREKLYAPLSTSLDGKGVPRFGTIVSLVCPLSGKRIKVPTRGRGCNHSATFDLQSFLEMNCDPEAFQRRSVQQPKKRKTEAEAWCCPICGSDATWPEIVVDRVLLRVLGALPEHMRKVCLLPNEKWRVVWSPAEDDFGAVDTKLTKLSIHLPFASSLHSGIHGIGQAKELRPGRFYSAEDETFCFRELQFLQKAYRAWKNGVDHRSTERMGLGRDANNNSTLAVWTDGRGYSRGDTSPLARQLSLASTGAISSARIEDMTDVSGEVAAGVASPISDDVPAAGAEGGMTEKSLAAEDERTRNASTAHRNEGSQAPGQKSVYGGTGGKSTPMRPGQYKSRPKLMCKRT